MKININRDLGEIKDVIWNDFGLKQTVALIIGFLLGIVTFLLCMKVLPTMICGYIAFIVAFPCLFLGFYSKNGMGAIESLRHIISQIIFPKTLLYVSTEEEIVNDTEKKEKSKEIKKSISNKKNKKLQNKGVK